jgi:hypothetical protein
MITRRKFIVLGAGLSAGLVGVGYSRLRVPASDAPGAALVQHDMKPSGAPTEVKVQAPGGGYAPPIADHHPDNTILDQIPGTEASPARPPDIILGSSQRATFDSTLARLRRLQNYVGYGNFNIIGWDESLKLARAHDSIGAFGHDELELIEELFFTNAATLGFYGDKVVSDLSATIAQRDIDKVPGTGHFLFKGASTDTYNQIRRDLGDSVILTSGIRSVVKQIYLFMNKAEQVDGNLSLASYSLAPPGHSYHAVGDFDVGKKGFGVRNFSEAFAHTDEFRRLIDLGYLHIRYPQQNPFGVRYEPWHIKVV